LGEFELQYLRDRDRREVDFILTKNGKPQLLLEAKLSDTTPSPAGIYYGNKLSIPFLQVVEKPGIKRKIPNSDHAVVSAHSLLSLLG
jgi:uncharacterized protein